MFYPTMPKLLGQVFALNPQVAKVRNLSAAIALALHHPHGTIIICPFKIC